MLFTIIVTGPAYGTQQSSSALKFAKALLTVQHEIKGVFFYLEGVNHANKFISPAIDEFNLTNEWQNLKIKYNVNLYVCTSASLRRGIISADDAKLRKISGFNANDNFILCGIGLLTEVILLCDRTVQF